MQSRVGSILGRIIGDQLKQEHFQIAQGQPLWIDSVGFYFWIRLIPGVINLWSHVSKTK